MPTSVESRVSDHPGAAKTDLAFALRGVSKVFGQVRALDGVTLSVERGETVGFVGLNGAGKSTTMRILLGLMRPDGGLVEALGTPVIAGERRTSPIGALIERPALHPHLSARDNLELFGLMRGMPRNGMSTQIDVLLREIGLGQVGRRRISKFSTGMQQRLGVITAFLGNPDLVVLDEPTDGLDPEGVVAVRELIRFRANAGATLFVSSHMLGEVEALADRVVGIHAGQIVMDVTRDALAGWAHLRVKFDTTEEASRAAARLSDQGISIDLEPDEPRAVRIQSDQGSAIARLLGDVGLYPAELVSVRPSLEATFLEITRNPAAKAGGQQ